MSVLRTPIQNPIVKVSVCAASLVGSMSGEVAGRDDAHHDDDNDEKGQWSRSIALLCSELISGTACTTITTQTRIRVWRENYAYIHA